METIKGKGVLLNASEHAEITEILSLPIRHKGGFQNRLLSLSAMFGIDHPEAPTPGSTRGTVPASPEPVNVPAAVNMGGLDVDRMARGINALRDAGLTKEADTLSAELVAAITGGTGRIKASANVAEVEHTTGEPGKARRKVRQTKARKARRSFGALSRHYTSAKIVASKMAEKYGPDWRTMIGAGK